MRGEELSAHTLVSMAADMLICLELQQSSMPSGADRLEPRRRLEIANPPLAQTLKGALFAPATEGIHRLAVHILRRRDTLRPTRAKVAEHLLD
jgi:hypothetical protein